MHEIELKFQVPEPAREGLAQTLQSQGARLRSMHAAYFDSPDRDLSHAGVALRLRCEDGQWVQTLKARGEGLVQRLEHNVLRQADGREAPALDLSVHVDHPAGRSLQRLLLLKGLTAADLRMQYETLFDRLALQLAVAEPVGLRLEVALDRGEVRARSGGALRSLPLSELEFELQEGPLQNWLEWLRPWVLAHGLWLDLRSKAERGDRLARGGSTPLQGVEPAAALRPQLEGVLRHAAELIEGLGDDLHRLALLQGLAALEGLADLPTRLSGELRGLQQRLAAAGPAHFAGVLSGAQTQMLLLDLLGLTLEGH